MAKREVNLREAAKMVPRRCGGAFTRGSAGFHKLLGMVCSRSFCALLLPPTFGFANCCSHQVCDVGGRSCGLAAINIFGGTGFLVIELENDGELAVSATNFFTLESLSQILKYGIRYLRPNPPEDGRIGLADVEVKVFVSERAIPYSVDCSVCAD